VKAETTPDAGCRRYLYLTAVVCGAAILIVEILGAKMLAPFFGTSHFVWTAQIAVTLVSLTVGYWCGGWLVDRSPSLGQMYAGIVGAAIYLGLTVPLCARLADACLEIPLALGSLLTSAFLFFLPLALLAMAGPFILRALTVSVTAVGGQAGKLSALSTVGSVLGTLLISYVLIPRLANSTTMYATAGTLLVVAMVYFFIWGKRRMGAVVLLVGSMMAGIAHLEQQTQIHFGGTVELDRRNSNFGLLQVLQATGGPRRYFLSDYLVQNVYDTERRQSITTFTYLLRGLAHAYTTKLDSVLCIGLGVGIVPMQLASEGAAVEVVEINPACVPLAQQYFDLQSDRMHLAIDDGRHFLNGCRQQYDAILLDAFLGDSTPAHLMTREAFTAMRDALRPDGTLIINAFGTVEPKRDYFTASLAKTLRAVFPSVRVHAAAEDPDTVFFVASSKSNLEFVRQPDLTGVHPRVRDAVAALYATTVTVNSNHGQLLTDDFNPVEFHDAANRERLRRQMALTMRSP
jgi:spermidine synthase